jgi:iron complex outermembrane recepter protein
METRCIRHCTDFISPRPAEIGAAVAQETALTEVVVTAQKRTSGVQEVAFAVVVSTGDQNRSSGPGNFDLKEMKVRRRRHQKHPGGLPLVGVSAALGLAAGGELLAQEASPNPNQLQEVVVTAEKRSSTVQDTPISITAVTGKDIEERGLSDFTALSETVPGISMKTSGAGQTEFEMRGMTSSGGNSATVGFYLDDVPLSAPAAAQNGKVVIDPDLYDLNRVEVLRGPQGTLYGSGSMGGTIKVVTNQPDPNNFDVSGKLILSDTKGGSLNNGENGMLNLPLGNGGTAALRVVGTYEHDSGWISRIVIGDESFPLETGYNPALGTNATRGNVLAAPIGLDFKGINDEDLTGARATLLLKPSDRLSITPSIFYQKITQDGLSQIDSDPGTEANYQPFNQPEPFTDRFDLASLSIQYHFDAADLTSETAYWTRDEELRQDGSEELQWALSPALAPFGCPNPLPFYTNQPCGLGPTSPTTLEDDRSWQTTEELRLASAGDTQFKWLLGYFYQDFESDWDLYADQPGAAPIFGTANAFTQIQPTRIIQNSFFGEASYQFTSQLTGTVGLRRYSYGNNVRTAVSGFLSSTGSDTIANSLSSERNQGINPKLNLSYQADKDLLVYATASKGFRPGGANQPIATSGSLGTTCEANLQAIYGTKEFVPAPFTFAPDDVWTYELGEKWRSNDARLTVNGAIYYSDWNSAQQFVPLPCGFNFSTNTGDARIYGAELEINALLTDNWQLEANGGYTHAQFVASSVLPGVAAANGLGVQDVPEWTSAISLVYRQPVASGTDFMARVDDTYTASRTEVTYALYTLPSYSLTNFRMGFEGGNWSAMLFANNVANKVAYLSNAYQINVNIPTFSRITVAQPLTIGIDLTYRLK